jgi:hypothetical protein
MNVRSGRCAVLLITATSVLFCVLNKRVRMDPANRKSIVESHKIVVNRLKYAIS